MSIFCDISTGGEGRVGVAAASGTPRAASCGPTFGGTGTVILGTTGGITPETILVEFRERRLACVVTVGCTAADNKGGGRLPGTVGGPLPVMTSALGTAACWRAGALLLSDVEACVLVTVCEARVVEAAGETWRARLDSERDFREDLELWLLLDRLSCLSAEDPFCKVSFSLSWAFVE